MTVYSIIGYIFLGCGVFLTMTTMLGFARFDNIYTRIHISTMNDMLGIPFAILGTAFLFLDITPVTSYIIIKIVYFYCGENNKID